MVSPCKKEDTQNHNVKYSFSNKKQIKSSFVKGSRTDTIKNKLKQFANKVIYLDLKSPRESINLEVALKSLGAVIAVFLDRSVTLVVSDRVVGVGGSSTIASPAASVSPLQSQSSCTSERFTLPRTRGAAMLERVSGISSAGYADPVTLALQWHVPVLSAAKLWVEISRLETICQKRPASNSKPKSRPDFIKIESLVGNLKPDLLKLQRWPVLNLDCPMGQSPFQWDADMD